MDKQLVIVIDQPPLERSAWVRNFFAQADLFQGEPDEVSKVVKADPEGARVLRETYLQRDAQHEVAPWYRKAFAQLYGDKPRVGIYGGGWLNLLAPDVDACIVDWSGMSRVTSEMANELTLQEIEQTKAMGLEYGRNYVAEREAEMPQTRFFTLPDGIDDAQRTAQAAAFVREHFR